MAYIYQIINKQNGKRYIGKTVNSISERWNNHKKDYLKDKYKNRPLYRAMNKYGLDSFEINQIEECHYEELNDRERYWIEFYGTFKNGYNATRGGDGSQYIDYKKIFDLYQKNFSYKEITELIGCCEDTVISALKNYHLSANERFEKSCLKKQKAVLMLDKNTEKPIRYFASIKEALNYLQQIGNSQQKSLKKMCGTHISAVCKGKRKTAYGYKWKYLALGGPQRT